METNEHSKYQVTFRKRTTIFSLLVRYSLSTKRTINYLICNNNINTILKLLYVR